MSATAAKQFVITRDFDAPRELVFQAWTTREGLMRWWGPRVFTVPECEVDLRVGGKWKVCMRSPDGQDFWCGGEYLEIAGPERLVWMACLFDAAGDKVSPSYYGMHPDWPEEAVCTAAFEDLGGKTRLTLTHTGVDQETAESQQAIEGWNQSFDKLAEAVAR